MPIYSLTAQYHIRGRILLIILYILLRVPFTTTYLLNFFDSLSRSYEEAAAIDGCTPAKTFWKIMFPLIQPAIVTVTIFNFMSVWNEFFMALIFATSTETTPVGVGPVSYTHLDVYKRQAAFCAAYIPCLVFFYIIFTYHDT